MIYISSCMQEYNQQVYEQATIYDMRNYYNNI